MANVKIPDLTPLGANVADGDLFELADISAANASKSATRLQIIGLGSTGITTLGTITTGAFPIANITGLGANVAAFLGTPSSANLAAAVTGETGSGALVFATSPTLVTPALGTPSALVLTNATGLPTAGLVDDAVTLAKIQNAAANSKLIGSGAAGAGANYVEITLGTGLAMSGTTLNSTGSFDQGGNYTLTGTWDFTAATVSFGTVSITTINASSIVFEGSTPDAFETTLGVTDPTADNTITLPNASGDVVLTSSGVLLSNIVLGEAAGNLFLDPTLSADGTWSGIAIDGTAGATLAFGDLCYFAAVDSRWELADADAAATAGDVMIGICVLAAASDGDATRMLLRGVIRADAAFPSFTISAPVYISTTAGDVTTTQPSGTDDVIRCVGHARTADVLYFSPDNIYLTHV